MNSQKKEILSCILFVTLLLVIWSVSPVMADTPEDLPAHKVTSHYVFEAERLYKKTQKSKACQLLKDAWEHELSLQANGQNRAGGVRGLYKDMIPLIKISTQVCNPQSILDNLIKLSLPPKWKSGLLTTFANSCVGQGNDELVFKTIDSIKKEYEAYSKTKSPLDSVLLGIARRYIDLGDIDNAYKIKDRANNKKRFAKRLQKHEKNYNERTKKE